MDIISKLKQEGVLKLYQDYRSGSFSDLSGNDNDGVPTNGINLNRKGSRSALNTTTDWIATPDSAELQLTTGTIIVFGNFVETKADVKVLISKRDSGGTNYSLKRKTLTGNLAFWDGIIERTLSVSTANAKYYGVNITHGSIPVGYMDGVSVGNFSGAVTVATNDAPIYVGGEIISGGWCDYDSRFGGALVISRELTALEHAQLYAQLEAMKWPTAQHTSRSADTTIDNAEVYNEIAPDVDMELSGTGYFLPGGATPSKEASTLGGGTQCLRGTAASTGYIIMRDVFNSATPLTVGRTYRFSGWARGDGLSAYPRAYIGTGGATWTGTTSNEWQYFNVTVVATDTFARLYTWNTGYAEWNNLSIIETGELIAGYNMDVIDGTIYDVSDNANNIINVNLVGGRHERNRTLGKGLKLNGAGNGGATSASIGLSGDPEFTVSFIARWDGDSWTAGGYTYVAPFKIGTSATAQAFAPTFYNGNLAMDFYNVRWAVTTLLDPRQPYVITMTKKPGLIGSTCKIYVNGIEAAATLGGSDQVPNITNDRLFFGYLNPSASFYWKGFVGALRIENAAWSPDKVLAEYNKIKDTAIDYQTAYGVPETIANTTTGRLDNTNWRILSGYAMIQPDEINGSKIKALVATGGTTNIVLDAGLLGGTTGSAFGSWEFWFYCPATLPYPPYIYFDVRNKDAYTVLDEAVSITTAFAIGAVRVGNDFMIRTADAYISGETWYKYTITKDEITWRLFLNDVEVTGVAPRVSPRVVTGNWDTSAQFKLVVPPGCKLSLGDINGNYAFVKKTLP